MFVVFVQFLRTTHDVCTCYNTGVAYVFGAVENSSFTRGLSCDMFIRARI